MTFPSNYQELQTSLSNWLRRSDLTPRFPEFIAYGETLIFRDLRIRQMEASANVTVVSSTVTSQLPASWLQGREVYISGAPTVRLEQKTLTEFRDIFHNAPTAKPEVYCIIGEDFHWGPTPDTGYTAVVDYYKEPDRLTQAADTNALFTLAPQLYTWASLIQAAPYLGNDGRVQLWISYYEDLIERIQRADERDRYSGDTLVPERAAQMT